MFGSSQLRFPMTGLTTLIVLESLITFVRPNYSYVVPDFQKHLGLPNPRPVLCKNSENNFLVDGGNGKYYLYNDISDYVMELYERNLDNILTVYIEKRCRTSGISI